MYQAKVIRKRQELLCFLVLVFLPSSYSSGKLSIQLLDYKNAGSRAYDGGCCDNMRYCVSSCDNYFVLCLAGLRGTDKCSLYRGVTQVTSDDSFSFSNSLGNGLRNPVIYAFTAWQPLEFSVEVWDDDSSNVIGTDPDLIDRYTLNIQQIPSANNRNARETRHRLTGRQSTMNIKVKVYCDDFYFAPNCSTYCKSRNNSTGHYTCDYTRGHKVCLQGWYGKDCLVYCRPRNDSSGHYNCNEMGQKLCLNGWMGENCTQENTSTIHQPSANSVSIDYIHLTSTIDGSIAFAAHPSSSLSLSPSSSSSASPSVTSSHPHLLISTTSLARDSTKPTRFYSSHNFSIPNKIVRTISLEIRPSANDSSIPVPTLDTGPIAAKSSLASDNGALVPASASDHDSILQTSILDISTIVSTLASAFDKPSHNGSVLQTSILDVETLVPSSIEVSLSDHVSFLLTSTLDIGTIVTTSIATSDNGQVVLPRSSSDRGPLVPVSSIYTGTMLPPSSFDIDRDQILSPTTVAYPSHLNSASVNHTWFRIDAHSTKTTPPLGATPFYSHVQGKVTSTVVANEMKPSATVAKTVAYFTSRGTDCSLAALNDSSLNILTPVFMEIETTYQTEREYVIEQIKPLMLLKTNEFCRRKSRSCNIPDCLKDSNSVFFQIKQLDVELSDKTTEEQSKMTLQLRLRLPGRSKGIVPPDVLLEILETALSDIEQSCDAHVIRIWIENTTDRPITALLKNHSPSSNGGSIVSTVVVVGTCAVVAMVIGIGILWHRLKNVPSRRLKVNPLTDDDDSTPPDSPVIATDDKTSLLCKHDSKDLTTSPQWNEELELTSTIPGTVT